MEHYAPHHRASFEGYYSKFDLPSGAHIALIICSVPDATDLPPHMVSFTYYSKSGSAIYHREHFVSEIHRVTIDTRSHAFELRVPGMGSMRCEANSKTTYDLTSNEWKLRAETVGRLPWGLRSETPEGWMVRLPLPLHWHVHSLCSPCITEVDIPSFEIAAEDHSGKAAVHQEKNWADSFPSAHMWVQAHSPSTGSTICLAGGEILGTTAYLLGYRSTGVDISFRPPLSLAIFGWSPFMSVDVDWENRAFSLCVSGLWRKIEVRAKAPRDKGWFGISAPFSEGFRKNFLTESFLANVDVRVFERSWLGRWKEVKHETFQNGSLEFGGAYFPHRGEKED
ncbi:uncharacterized protein EI97DRAFT_54006 [Westerdykella ornata]|uniref:Uncharacterized protein n=1 Tax=Westerdykella ornata TaxID=318751 RepID=A0A6A6JMW6_WESOR|nr:uncharacterized protein EI97DRAFT_54006 [Westerdykella ornata]KAF2276279.1 hypothetical protein EI97DRAFT_54006 [Westerdykella ornata]